MHYYPFCTTLDPIMAENPLVVLCLANRTPVEVEWQVLLVGFMAFYTLLRHWKWSRI
jgi:hypothetical protein